MLLSASGLRSPVLRGVSLKIRKGEILGLGGLVGQGQGSLLEALFGAHALTAGTIDIDGAPFERRTPRTAISAGLAYVPQERKSEGLLLAKSVADNITYAILRQLRSFFGLLDPRYEGELVRGAIARAKIHTRGGAEPIANLSGGNQQKALLEKWLLTKPSILLLNDVTRGVDIGTKRLIYALIAEIARNGVAVIWYSTDARELVGVVHRVLVMLQGRINEELTGDNITVDRIVRASSSAPRFFREARMPAPRASRFQLGDNWPVLVFVGLLAVLIGLKGRFTGFDAHSLSVNAMPLTLIALGQFLVVLTRGVDLSLGPVASVAGAVMALTITDHPFLGLAAPTLIGFAAGLVNGFFVARLDLPPIIVTLATMSVWQGVALIVLPNPGGSVPTAFQTTITGGFSSPVAGLAGVLLCIIGGTWLLSTRFGLHLRAVGGDEHAARMSGVRVEHVKAVAYVLAGTARGSRRHVSYNRHRQRFADRRRRYILTSIAAVVIGGVPLSGGRGTPVGVAMGALILTITGSLLYFADISSFYQSVIDGLILLAVVGSSATREWLHSIASGARLTVSEDRSPMDALRPAAGGRRFRGAAPALLIVFSLLLVFVGERLAPGFATVANMLQL